MAVNNTFERTPGLRGTGLGGVGQRLTSLLRGTRDREQVLEDSEPTSEFAQQSWSDEDVLPRFPFSRNGYHCASVDAHIAELEQELLEVDRELAELKSQSTPADEVSVQIKRIGEQTSAVLMAANEQRDQMLRTAQEEADRCVADARAKAALITSEAEARVRGLRDEHRAAELERDRLLDDVRNVSAALAVLADAKGRIPGETEEIAAGDLRPDGFA